MNFTTSQKKALAFMVLCFSVALVYHWLDRWLHPREDYDFSQFERRFYARYDSIQPYLNGDSLFPETIVSETTAPRPSTEPGMSSHSRVNINTATLTELTTLPRIGPTIAARIIEYRSRKGSFNRPGDLLQVKGIGPKTFEKLREHIAVK